MQEKYFSGKNYVVIAEIKSTHDANTVNENLEITSDSKVIKNNKRSAQHQLRDHMEILENFLDLEKPLVNPIQCYIMWPFLNCLTRDPKQQVMKRWKEDGNLHVFEGMLQDQKGFNKWFQETVLNGRTTDERNFIALLNR